MKVTELLNEMETKGSWKIQNLSGNFKNFKDKESPEAMAWISNRGPANQVWIKHEFGGGADWHDRSVDREAKDEDRAARRAEREEARAARGPKYDYKEIYNKTIDMIGESFPDGDPIDMLGDWFKRTYGDSFNCLEQIDKAMRKYGSGLEKKGMYAYLADMWEEHAHGAQWDELEGMKNGHDPEDNPPFVDVERNPEAVGGWDVKVGDNPWLSQAEQKKIRDKRAKEEKVMVAQMMTALKKKEKEQK